MKLNSLLALLNDKQGSDLFITVGMEPCIRLNGHLQPLGSHKLDGATVSGLLRESMSDEAFEHYVARREANFAIQLPQLGRFRISAFWQQDLPGMVVRRIQTHIPTMEELQLPPVLRQLALTRRGLILFVGATSAGKSSTQAAIIGYRNQQTDGHILTIEDPVEFVHQHGRCMVTQREVGTDTVSFAEGLKSALRQSPDLILIGEIRDQETMEFALSFAETGHLCLATLHANNANQAIDRIMHLVPPEKHRQLLYDLSCNLKAVVAQQLLPSRNGSIRAPAFEILINTPLVADILRKGEMHRLKEVMANSREQGMQTFDQSLFELYRDGRIGYTEALAHADSANEVRLMIKLSGGNDLSAGLLDNVTVG